jgi:MFS family permease
MLRLVGSTSEGGKVRFYYGWVIVAVVFLRAFTTGGTLWTTGILSVSMHDDLGWSRTIVFAGITLSTLGAAITGIFWGQFMDKTGGARILAFGSSIVAAVCLMLVSQVHAPWQFLLIFGVNGILGAGPAQLLMAATVPKWFIRRRGFAMATSSMGTGLAAFILPPIITGISENLGWREAWLFLGCVAVVLAVLPSLLLRTQPEDIGLLPDGDTEPLPAPSTSTRVPAAATEYSFTRAEAFKTSTLWMLMLVSIFGMVSPTAFPTNLVPALTERGFSESTAALAFSAYGMTSFFGRFFWGWLSDRLHIRKTLLVISTYCGMSVPMLLLLPGDVALCAGAVAGLGIGGWVGLNQMMWPVYFGRGRIGAITGAVRPMITLSGALGPLYVAGLAEYFDSYTISIVVMALSWWLCAAVLLFVRSPRVVTQPAAEPVTATSAAG